MLLNLIGEFQRYRGRPQKRPAGGPWRFLIEPEVARGRGTATITVGALLTGTGTAVRHGGGATDLDVVLTGTGSGTKTTTGTTGTAAPLPPRTWAETTRRDLVRRDDDRLLELLLLD